MQQEFLERFLFPGNRAGVRALLRRGSLNAGKAWIGGRLRRQQPILKCCVLGPRSLAGWNQGSHSSTFVWSDCRFWVSPLFRRFHGKYCDVICKLSIFGYTTNRCWSQPLYPAPWFGEGSIGTVELFWVKQFRTKRWWSPDIFGFCHKFQIDPI